MVSAGWLYVCVLHAYPLEIAGGRGGHKMKNEKLIKEAEAVNSAIEMLIDMKANEPWISFYIGKVWAFLDQLMNENEEKDT